MPLSETPRRHRWWLASAVFAMTWLALLRADHATAADGESALAARMLKAVGEQAGLCVHLGFRDGELPAAMSGEGKFLVHGLSSDAEAVEAARKLIRARGLAGAVSVEQRTLAPLPYSNNLANLVVAEDVSSAINDGALVDEMLRVLRPGGVAFVGESATAGRLLLSEKLLRDRLAKQGIETVESLTENGQFWFSFKKPRSADLDEWTHRRYDATNNPVSQDKVGVPTGVRWVAGQNWPTGNRKASVPAVVTSKDRLVYVFDDLVNEDTQPQRQNVLVARDAFNGLPLWQRTTSSESSPLLIHVEDRVYTVVEDGGPLVALDAKTGEIAQTYADAAQPLDVSVIEGQLFVRTRSDVRCVDVADGKMLWRADVVASNAVVGEGRVYLQTAGRSSKGERVHEFICMDLKTGQELWRNSTEKWPQNPSGLDLVFYQSGVLVLGGSGTHAISATDGSHLWTYNYRLIGHGGSYVKVMYMNGLVWVHNDASAGPDGKVSNAWEGLDPQTGKVQKRLAHGGIKHRCSYDVATGRYFLCGSMDFVDLEKDEHTRFAAARNSCRAAGVVPANGLVYSFPHGCACYPLLRGFLGLESNDAPIGAADATSTVRLEQGPAFGSKADFAPHEEDWPTHRHDATRTSSTASPGPAQLAILWQRIIADVTPSPMREEWDHKTGARMTSSVVADGMVYVASTDTHELFALDEATGEPRWQFTAGGRIDCPPTIHDGLCLLGARDGWVYCLRADDGRLVWRYRAAPDARRIVAHGQLESAWPVVGGVLVSDGVAYFAVGRHGAADGGVHVYAANPKTGEIIWHKNPERYATLPDLLVSAGESVHMADWKFDAKSGSDSSSSSGELLSSSRLGLLNDDWYKRPLALRKNLQQWSASSGSGQLLSFNEEWVCGFIGASRVNGGDGSISGHATLFAKPLSGDGKAWSLNLPLGTQVKGMVLADKSLLIAGRLDGYDEKSNALRTLSVADGKLVAQQSVPGPLVHECLTVARNKVYVSTQGGKFICLGNK